MQFLGLAGSNMLYWSMATSMVSLHSDKFSQDKILFWINIVQQMHHEPKKFYGIGYRRVRQKLPFIYKHLESWLSLCLWNSNFVWGKDMHTVDLICLLAPTEGLGAVTRQGLVRQSLKTTFLLMPLLHSRKVQPKGAHQRLA